MAPLGLLLLLNSPSIYTSNRAPVWSGVGRWRESSQGIAFGFPLEVVDDVEPDAYASFEALSVLFTETGWVVDTLTHSCF